MKKRSAKTNQIQQNKKGENNERYKHIKTDISIRYLEKGERRETNTKS